MTHRIRAYLFVPLLLLTLSALLFAGCATVYEGKLDSTLFLRSPASLDTNVNAQIAVVADVALTQFKYEREKRGQPRLVIPVGQVVEAAACAAMSDVFGRSVVQYSSPEAAVEANRSTPQLTLVAPRPVTFELHDESVPFLLPIPYMFLMPISTRQDVRLIVDWQVLGSDGRLLWTKRYDSGDVTLPFKRTDDRDSKLEYYFVHLTHEAAYTLMHQAAQDVRKWFEAERLRERVL
ncbi:MAG: hypothetical protein IPI40_03975 [Betaproteobacteria bacterium]|nr:hypothetical protein [Betaproteobacteria bacterium]MBK7742883.1 hypothetical protein [Betaproteobacteria bacterium]MBK8688057.1 hypothetical protein [Betaproteobacteria bacterium]